jgi:Spy/CpxP family protein refolding chaperone
MKALSKIAVGAVATAGIGLAAVALAQGPGFGPGPGGGYGAGMHGPHRFGGHGPQDGASVDAHLNTLKSELKLTGNQTKVWETFEKAVRNQAQTMTEARASMPAGQQNPDAHIAFMEQRLAGMKTVQKARTDLYNVLTSEQKAVADRFFGGPHA